MAKSFPLDLYIIEGKTYRTPEDVALIIKKIGTNSSGAGHLHIDRKDLFDIKELIAPLHKTSSNLLGPLDLKEKYYVVPPGKEFRWIGDSGSKCRLIGDLIILGPGETLGEPYRSRFENQHKSGYTYVEGTYAFGTDEAWKADQEVVVLSLTPLTVERYTFNGPVMVSISGDTVSEGDFGIRFKYQRAELDALLETTVVGGIDALSMPRPPADTTEQEPFTLEKTPIVVEGDKTLEIRARNISGADKSPASGSNWSVTVTAIVLYESLGGA